MATVWREPASVQRGEATRAAPPRELRTLERRECHDLGPAPARAGDSAQRERPAAVWGTADPEADITVTFKKETAKATADANGKWRVEIPTGAADATGAELQISSGDDSITIADVLVGEVWFASGQSNMYFTMNRVPDYAELIKKSNYPQIRMFDAPLVTAIEPRDDIEGDWTARGPLQSAFEFTQLAWCPCPEPGGVAGRLGSRSARHRYKRVANKRRTPLCVCSRVAPPPLQHC